jgi:hypothetical protein
MGMSELDLPKRLARYSSITPDEKDVSAEWVRDTLADVYLTVDRIALTAADTIALGAEPRFPATDKKKDTRYRWFVQNYGEWCWELDALSPNILRKSLAKAIRKYLDQALWDRYVAVEELERDCITKTCESWTSILQQDQQ